MLRQAILQGNTQEVKRIISADPSAINRTNEGETPLPLLAALIGEEEMVRFLVEYSFASMDIRDVKGRDMLHYAALSGNPKLCRYLVERVGLRPDRGDSDLVTPFDLARDPLKRRAALDEALQGNMAVEKRSFEVSHPAVETYFAQELGAAYEEMYHNPVRSGFFPDPSILRVGEDYYMVNSSFLYFPCIPISHSRDLIHWKIVGHAITNPQWSGLEKLESGRGYWAPDLSYDESSKRFYITATYRNNDAEPVRRMQMVTTSDRPEGPYGKPVFLMEDGIDPSLYHENGRHYMLLNRGARMFEISEDGAEKLSEPTLLYYGDQKHAPEGPHLLKKDGWYYLFLAEGGTGMGHRITVARSREIMGRYEPCPYNPIMRQEDPLGGLQRAGHGKPVCTPDGRWYMVYLCSRRLEGKYSILGRETALDPLEWTADGWPIVNGLRGPGAIQRKPFPELVCEDSAEENIWMTLREPGENDGAFEGSSGKQKTIVSYLAEQGDCVCADPVIFLKEGKLPLSDVRAGNLLLRRQTGFDFACSVELGDKRTGGKSRGNSEQGIVCYYNEDTWLTFGRQTTEQGSFWKVKEHIGDIDREYDLPLVKRRELQKEEPRETRKEVWNEDRKEIRKETRSEARLEAVRLCIRTKGLKRSFWVEACSGQGADNRAKEMRQENLMTGQAEKLTEELTLENVFYLSDEGLDRGKRFTGAMVGLYALCGEEKEPETACFRHFDYRNL